MFEFFKKFVNNDEKPQENNPEVSSVEGQGSKFVFTLTKAKQDQPSHTGQTEILISNKPTSQ